jgi:hypothetical protein
VVFLLLCKLRSATAIYTTINKPPSDWKNFSEAPDKTYQVGQTISVQGLIDWYEGDPVIYVHRPGQIQVAGNSPVAGVFFSFPMTLDLISIDGIISFKTNRRQHLGCSSRLWIWSGSYGT